MGQEIKEQVGQFFDQELPEGWEQEIEEEEDFFGHREDSGDGEGEGGEGEGEGDGEGSSGEGEGGGEEEGDGQGGDPPSPTGGTDDPPVVEEEGESEELKALKEQNALLLQRIESFMEGGGKKDGEPPAQQQQQQPQTPSTLQPNEEGMFDFVGDEDIDDIVSDKNKFNAVINNAVRTVLSSVQAQLPQVTRHQVTTQMKVNETVREFYTENEDLVPVKKMVGFVANEVAREHPDWELSKIFEETATRARTMLGLKKPGEKKSDPPPASSSAKEKGRSPALPSSPKTGGKPRGGKAPLTGQAKHINDVL